MKRSDLGDQTAELNPGGDGALLLRHLRRHEYAAMWKVLSAGADPNRSLGDMTPIGQACEQADERAVRILLNAGADPNAPVYPRDGWSITPLITALGECATACVRTLLLAGADPNRVCDDFSCQRAPTERCTPLVLAEMTCNAPARALLLAHGADPQFPVSCGITRATFHPIRNIRAYWLCPVRRAARLIEQTAGASRIDHAITRVRDLDQENGKLLRAACLCHRADLVQMLLDAGANPNAMRRLSLVGADGGSGTIAALLLANGYDPSAEWAGMPMNEACAAGHERIVELLLRAGMDPDIVPQREFVPTHPTPLIVALLNDRMGCVDLLLRAGADPNLAARFSRDGGQLSDAEPEAESDIAQTRLLPLSVAVARGSIIGVRLLLQHGADANRVDCSGHGPGQQVNCGEDQVVGEQIRRLLRRHRFSTAAEPLF